MPPTKRVLGCTQPALGDGPEGPLCSGNGHCLRLRPMVLGQLCGRVREGNPLLLRVELGHIVIPGRGRVRRLRISEDALGARAPGVNSVVMTSDEPS